MQLEIRGGHAVNLSLQDIHDIQQLVNLYGHILDERQFSRVHELFTADACYDVSDFESGIHFGSTAIAQLWKTASDKHPLAHHATNIVVTVDVDGTVRAISKGLGVRTAGGLSTVVYRDVMTRTPAGWRIAERIAIRRRPEVIPDPS
jgi:hypothetical protein